MRAPELGEQYESLETQEHALTFGMWLFLATEILLFAALFALYAGYRAMYPVDFRQGIAHNTLAAGTINTYVLLASSGAAALSVAAIRAGQRRLSASFLIVTALLGLVFLGIKAWEYRHHVHEGALPGAYYHLAALPTFGANRFYTLYWVMTGFHALHVTVGVGVVIWMAVRALGGAYTADYHTKLEMGTLYWHLVDLVWLFLWPLLYLS